MKGYGYYSRRHQVVGFANSVLIANAKFVNIGFDIIVDEFLVAKYPLRAGTEVFVCQLRTPGRVLTTAARNHAPPVVLAPHAAPCGVRAAARLGVAGCADKAGIPWRATGEGEGREGGRTGFTGSGVEAWAAWTASQGGPRACARDRERVRAGARTWRRPSETCRSRRRASQPAAVAAETELLPRWQP